MFFLRDTGSTTGTFIKINGKAPIFNVIIFILLYRIWSYKWVVINFKQDIKIKYYYYKLFKDHL
jgi:hypothetical protein